MKKIILIATLGMFALVSCKKDYTCSCTVAGVTTKTEILDSKKSDAEDACDKLNTTASIAGGSCSL